MGIALIVVVVLLLAVALSSVRSVPQAKVGVVTMFGKYRRVMNPGLNFKMPVIERINSYVPVQNQTAQLEFVAITIDQASVKFATTIIFTVKDHSPETMQKVAFLFINAASFQTAMTAQVEAAVRSLVATKQQAEVLGLRGEIINHAKETLDEQLESWGYLLVDLAINDIQFDAEVMASMSRVVAAKNSVIAAENEGQALLVKRTKEAEANGAFIRIGAENEAKAAKLRGEGLAAFRTELTKGLSESTAELAAAGADPALVAFAMWTETVVQAAKDGQGNVLFLDGSTSGMEETFKRLQGLTALQSPMKPKPAADA
ncbi:MAG TPA: SPFH domain-containing protein [Nocardioides sp.]|nr:SPFH domain-containing protein [Nocardioides sp.]